jgi:gliding motility-associated-like protein
MVNDTICPNRYCKINFPNAFSPNNDGLNDAFRPYYYGNLNGYMLSIYNRWGERLFTSYKIDEGWNGEFRGALVDMGVYFYECKFYCPLLGYINLKGDVTLIR